MDPDGSEIKDGTDSVRKFVGKPDPNPAESFAGAQLEFNNKMVLKKGAV